MTIDKDDKVYELTGLEPVTEVRTGLRRGRASATMLAALWSGVIKVKDVYSGTNYLLEGELNVEC